MNISTNLRLSVDSSILKRPTKLNIKHPHKIIVKTFSSDKL